MLFPALLPATIHPDTWVMSFTSMMNAEEEMVKIDFDQICDVPWDGKKVESCPQDVVWSCLKCIGEIEDTMCGSVVSVHIRPNRKLTALHSADRQQQQRQY